VVLVHGLSVPYFIFDPTFAALTGAGFRALRFDLFGRGLSDRPHVDYSLDIFVDQLAELLRVVKLASPLRLIGLSMGAPICAAFAARFPRSVDRLVLIDPAGARDLKYPSALRLLLLPGVGELAAGLIPTAAMLEPTLSRLFGPALVDRLRPRYVEQTRYKGFRRALLSTLRNHALDSKIELYRQVGNQGAPVLILWGRDDQVVPLEYNLELRRAMPQARLRVIEDCGHAPHFERPETVNPILIRFLRG
jgi:pimeloyl-ACP methyl ester carboxylesterase